MTALTRLRRLSIADWALLAEALLVLAAVAAAIALLPFQRVARSARPPRAPAPDGAGRAAQVRRVRWAVTACARRVPWRGLCLEQGFAAQWMLRRRGIPAIVHYGMARDGGALIAHAWVKAGAIEVVGCEVSGDFAEVARFPAGAA